ncbi:MAG: polysaccharide pyruvyl transferase family protein [Clostridia bacterium]|nr:polysaccharide pyruvyl transferase family protein [Clostridia bacterium]
MKKYVLFGHSGSYNHGCEAIVRSTRKILGEDNRFYLFSKIPREDIEFNLNKDFKIIEDKEYKKVPDKSFLGIYYRLLSKFNKNLSFDDREWIYNNKQLLIKDSVALSVGGDNYCYNGIINELRPKTFSLKHNNIPSVLWGCSIGKEYLSKGVINDLKSYSLITARESLTIENLYNVGIKDNVIPCSDPAFTLDLQSTDFKKDIFDSGNVIGLNVSDFMKFYEPYKGATIKNFLTLIKHLLKTTDAYIALIPHVNKDADSNDDYRISCEVAKQIGSERVVVAEKTLNCMQLKYLISKCKQFVGCRTHSTIAAYSTCVPTLVVGYSVKSKGIAKDIFGDYNGYVVDGKSFTSDDDLKNAYIAFSEMENDIKKRLVSFMPEYIKRAYNGKSRVEGFFS